MSPSIKTSPVSVILVALFQAGCFHNTSLSFPDADANSMATTGGDVGPSPTYDAQTDTSVTEVPDGTGGTGVESETGSNPTVRKRIALNSEGGPGQSPSVNGNMGGLAGADRACQAGADYERLGGTWRAWLSDSNTNAIDRIADVGPWYTLDGHLAFRNKAQLATVPDAVIEHDQAGRLVAASGYWTGTHLGGTKAGENCNNWTSASREDLGVVGMGRDVTGGWTELTHPSVCLQGLNLLCIEQ